MQVPTQTLGLVDDLLGMRPRVRLITGLLLVATSLGASVLLWDAGRLWGAALFAAMLGVVGVVSGLNGLRHERVVAAEVARAEAQWADLRRELELAQRTGQGIGKTLTRLGYHDLAVRSWIRSEFGIDPPAPPPNGGCAADE